MRRRLQLPRRLRPTRAGWVFFALVFAVGFAALNTGNNLLYLVLSLMLAFLVLSGILSEAALRGIRVERRLPFEWVAGRASRVVLEISNAQPRTWSHAIVVEDLGSAPRASQDRALGTVFAMLVAPGRTESRSYRFEPDARGELRFRAFRVSTRFPFGLFVKSLEIPREATVIVYPRLTARRAPRRLLGEPRTIREAEGRGARNAEVTGLRDFARGDSPRRVHWRASARRGVLLVREEAGSAGGEAEVILRTRGAAEDFETAVARAASQAESGLREGLRVALRTDTQRFGSGTGAVHRARLLGFLALVEPERDADATP
jgi:uncharacterized protein (DUF58 family)